MVDRLRKDPVMLPPALGAVVEAVMARDREWLAAHPDKDEYTRQYVPGELGLRSQELGPRVTYVRVLRGPMDKMRVRRFLDKWGQPI